MLRSLQEKVGLTGRQVPENKGPAGNAPQNRLVGNIQMVLDGLPPSGQMPSSAFVVRRVADDSIQGAPVGPAVDRKFEPPQGIDGQDVNRGSGVQGLQADGKSVQSAKTWQSEFDIFANPEIPRVGRMAARRSLRLAVPTAAWQAAQQDLNVVGVCVRYLAGKANGEPADQLDRLLDSVMTALRDAPAAGNKAALRQLQHHLDNALKKPDTIPFALTQVIQHFKGRFASHLPG